MPHDSLQLSLQRAPGVPQRMCPQCFDYHMLVPKIPFHQDSTTYRRSHTQKSIYTYFSFHMLKFLTLNCATDKYNNLRPMSYHHLHHKKRNRQLYLPIFQGLQYTKYHSKIILLRQEKEIITNTYPSKILCRLHPAFIQ